MKPPFTYYGSKGRLAPWIAALLPEHRLYFEPFCGSAAVLFAKGPAMHEVLNDISSSLTTFFRVLRDRPQDLRRVLELTPYSRDEYLAADLTDETLNDLGRARRFFVRTTQSFNGGGTGPAHRVSWANGMRSSGGSRATGVRRVVDQLDDVAERLRGVIVENRSYEHLLDLYDGDENAFYVDPPYLGSTRSSLDPAKRRSRDYLHDFTSEDQHRQLAEQLHGCRAAVLLSGYHSPLYDELYGDWYTVEVVVQRPSGNRRGHSMPRATEVVWSNRDIGAQGSMFDVLDFSSSSIAFDILALVTGQAYRGLVVLVIRQRNSVCVMTTTYRATTPRMSGAGATRRARCSSRTSRSRASAAPARSRRIYTCSGRSRRAARLAASRAGRARLDGLWSLRAGADVAGRGRARACRACVSGS